MSVCVEFRLGHVKGGCVPLFLLRITIGSALNTNYQDQGQRAAKMLSGLLGTGAVER